MASARPRTVLVINNNPEAAPGHYTQLLLKRVQEAGLDVHEARTVEAVSAYARGVLDGRLGDVGLIVTCGSPVELTSPLAVHLHVTKTTAAMLHFPNAPIVGICFGMQLLAVLYGGSLVCLDKGNGHPGVRCPLRRTEAPSLLLGDCDVDFVQWGSNYIFVEETPPRFRVTARDSCGRTMAMEHDVEHVYGVQFHPEVLLDEVGSRIIDRITGLTGQNRRTPSAQLWRCSTDCLARRSLATATAVPDSRACATAALLRGGSARVDADADVMPLPRRLAEAKREAMRMLQRDHCSDGGITVSALEAAVRALRRLGEAESGAMEDGRRVADGVSSADAAPCALRRFGDSEPGAVDAHRATADGSVGDDSAAESDPVGFEVAATCSAEAAERRLRCAVRDAVRSSRGCSAASSSRASASTAAPSPSASSSAPASPAPETPSPQPSLPASAQTAQSAPRELAARELAPCGSAAGREQSLHEVDLRLRRCLGELTQAVLEPKARGQLARKLADVRRRVLAELREEAAGAAAGLVSDARAAAAELELRRVASPASSASGG